MSCPTRSRSSRPRSPRCTNTWRRPAFTSSPPPVAALRAKPWWNWIGGPLGALIVLAGAAIAPKLGAATFIA
ncbi:MAG: DMT family transporter, partial [Planctomycetia bacterium]